MIRKKVYQSLVKELLNHLVMVIFHSEPTPMP